MAEREGKDIIEVETALLWPFSPFGKSLDDALMDIGILPAGTAFEQSPDHEYRLARRYTVGDRSVLYSVKLELFLDDDHNVSDVSDFPDEDITWIKDRPYILADALHGRFSDPPHEVLDYTIKGNQGILTLERLDGWTILDDESNNCFSKEPTDVTPSVQKGIELHDTLYAMQEGHRRGGIVSIHASNADVIATTIAFLTY
jgi:hypothetical protein